MKLFRIEWYKGDNYDSYIVREFESISFAIDYAKNHFYECTSAKVYYGDDFENYIEVN